MPPIHLFSAFSSLHASSLRAFSSFRLITPEQLSCMGTSQVAAHFASPLALSSAGLAALHTHGLDGVTLLRMDLSRLDALGLSLHDAVALQHAVECVRNGSPVTVLLILGEGREPVSANFESPKELEAFLARQGAAGLRSKENVLVNRFKSLQEGEVYTLDIASGGSLRADMDRAAASSDTDAKVVIASVKRAVVAASASTFGEVLTADVRNDIALRCEGELLGDVDCLFRGPTLHLLLERKRRLGNTGGAAAQVIAQMNATRQAYLRVGLDVAGGRKCRVESMLFAEALGDQAQQELLQAGVYVLCPVDMRILSPLLSQ